MIRSLCIVGLVLAACGCNPQERPANVPAKKTEQNRMQAMPDIQPLEYRIYGAGYRVVAQMDKAGHARIQAVETVDGKDQPPVTGGADLDGQAMADGRALLGQIAMASWNEKLVVAGTFAAVVAGAGGAVWDDRALDEDGPPRELRKWAEKHFHLALCASDLAKKRAEPAEAEGKIAPAAKAYKAAVDRLGDWWLPEGPAFDATELRYVEGKSALDRGDHSLALSKFKQVLNMRVPDYKKKYKM
jgi:hypothetical protein